VDRVDRPPEARRPGSVEGNREPPRISIEMIRRCLAGDTAAYEPVVRAYEPAARRVALGILRDPDAASDAVQEAFIKAYRGLAGFDPSRDFRPWLLRIVRNQCRDMLRRGKAGPGLERITPLLADRVASDADAGREARQAEARDMLWAALGRISVEHREALVLKELEGLGYGEIAQALGVPEGTVASRLYHARRALRAALEEMGVEYP
jgi:RNA polymerase sigma factor (sigma-70 family)